MGKAIPDAILDAMLDATEATHFTVCTTEPANYAAIAGVALTGNTAVGLITAGAGSPDGRSNTYAAVSTVAITGTGDAQHVAFHNNSNTLYFTTTCPLTALSSGGTVDVGQVVHTLRDPT